MATRRFDSAARCAAPFRVFQIALSFGTMVGLIGLAFPSPAQETATRRQIEEVIVTAERREATVSDTSISITAFTGQMLEDFGIRNQEDLQNYIPAAVIEPYDMAVRGVGRNFRSLGGDPGIATYLNGVYSEDFGIASTEGGLFDIERIEVLRGPQGTLYGRNAIGGAVNFINKLPTEQLEGEARAIYGDYDLQEWYGMVSGPIIGEVLQGRITGVKRTRDGYVKDLGPGPDVANYGDENYALSLRFVPTDRLEFNVRGNERSYRRRMGGADAAGIVNFADNGTDPVRDTTTYAWGFRAVNPGIACPDAFTRTAVTPATGVKGGVGCTVPGNPVFQFINPVDGSVVNAQRVVPGVDFSGVGTIDAPNMAYGADPAKQRMLGFDNLKGNDLVTATNGQQDEYFDHQAVSFDAQWQLNDRLAAKYIFGYTDYFYDRTSDVDLTDNTIFDNTFYVSQETEYVSHELQLFWDPTEKLSVTTGLFAYNAKINQRGDYFDQNCQRGNPCNSRHANDFPVPYGAISPALAFMDFTPKMELFTARKVGEAAKGGTPMPFYCLPLPGIPVYCFGKWEGDTGDRIRHGPVTVATNLEYQTRTIRDAYAAYTQAYYSFNEHWALTLGVRWAQDELYGYETVFYYTESEIVPLGFDPAGGGSSLAAINQAFGWLGPNGEILNPNRLLTSGLPTSSSLWRELDRKDDEITWRVNIDWTPTDDDLIYLSATKGYRSGGFNLVFFSSVERFEPETLVAYELGYKGAMLDGAMQLNAAVYFYDYENIHTIGASPSLIDPASQSVSVFAVPSAEMIGFEADLMWLATERLTLGGNFSYTHSEYTDDFLVVDFADPRLPESLFNASDSPISLKGKQLLRVPEMKGGAWGQYMVPLGDRGRVEVLASWMWIDKVYYSAFEADIDVADAYSRTDLRASWLSSDNAWTVAAFVNNVFDELGIRQIDRYQAGEAQNFRRAGATTDPRLWGLEVRYKFGAFR
jgi:iron complex outermembrane recepter protein